MERLLGTVGIIVSIMLGNTVESFDDGSHPKEHVQHSLCEELILPSGYPCSEYTIQTKDGFLLGLQRVSSFSSSLRLGDDGERGPPVLLLHGLFMDLAMDDLAEMVNYINSVTNSKLFVLRHSQGKKSVAAFTQQEIAEKVEAAALALTKGVHQLNHKRMGERGERNRSKEYQNSIKLRIS
ncbi:Triacylglycerol lipase 1 [Spatholobus suberectus]|nr:Triacylglycerol lipase 1 [Spatholobus suberectus]